MAIIRARLDFEGRFTQIPNDWLRDTRLSLTAKGLLAQLLTHSDGWNVSIQSLAKANKCGRDRIRSAVVELEKSGYLERTQKRNSLGGFEENVWITTSPPPDSPVSDNPTTGEPTTKNTNTKNTKNKLDLFEKFWELYPRKVGKASARKMFEKVIDQAYTIISAAERMANDKNLPPLEFIPYPATWLNREGWEDDPYPEREKKPEKPVAEVPGKRDWVKKMHDMGEHFECRPGEFGHKGEK